LKKQKKKIDPITIKNIYLKIKNVFLFLERSGVKIDHEEDINRFFELVEEDSQKYSITHAIRKALYTLTNNLDFYKKYFQRDFNYAYAQFNTEEFKKEKKTIKTIFWILYAYNVLIQKSPSEINFNDEKINDMLLFVFSYFYTKERIDTTYEKIRFDYTLLFCFKNVLRTSDAWEFLDRIEKYNKNVNAEMAMQTVKKKNILVKLLQDPNNMQFKKDIEKYLDQIAFFSHKVDSLKRGKKINNWIFKLFGVEGVSINSYLRGHVPPAILGGMHANKFLFATHSLASTMTSGVGYYIQKAWNEGEMLWSKDNKSYNHFLHNKSMFFIPSGIKFFYPERTIKDDEFFEKRKFSDFFLSKNEQNATIWNNPDVITFADKWYQWQHLPGMTGVVLGYMPDIINKGTGVAYIVGSTFLKGLSWWTYTGNILSFGQGLKLYYDYLDALRSVVLYSKKLCRIIGQLYQANNIPDEDCIREFIMMKKIFGQNGDSVFKSILEKTDNKFKLYYNTAINFIMPGLTAYSYFKEILGSVDLLIQKSFVGAVDIACAKMRLLEVANELFTIPEFIESNPHEVMLSIEDMWAPFTPHRVVNSVLFNNEKKNMMIVGPVVSGKTMILSILLTSLYLANMGIVPAKNCRLNYFDYIISHMEHPYKIGSGVSQHLAERASMVSVMKLMNFLSESKRAIILIDEIYRGTLPNLAVREAFKDLPPMLIKDNVISIITTHFPQITAMTKIPDYKMSLAYMFVRNVGNTFEATYKLLSDDESNWWIRDEEKAFAYQLSKDNKKDSPK